MELARWLKRQDINYQDELNSTFSINMRTMFQRQKVWVWTELVEKCRVVGVAGCEG